MSEKVVRTTIISGDVINCDGDEITWYDLECDEDELGVFDEGERVVVITEEEYERLVKVEKAARIMDAQIAKVFGVEEGQK